MANFKVILCDDSEPFLKIEKQFLEMSVGDSGIQAPTIETTVPGGLQTLLNSHREQNEKLLVVSNQLPDDINSTMEAWRENSNRAYFSVLHAAHPDKNIEPDSLENIPNFPINNGSQPFQILKGPINEFKVAMTEILKHCEKLFALPV